jgi:ADP-ribosyl-[dinitrogen reductase] hydrolase
MINKTDLNDFRDAFLITVSPGEDMDTKGTVTGGLTGLQYGLNDIPEEWTTN